MYRIETERADLFDINMMIAMKVSVSGYAPKEKITEAFYNAIKSYEILNTKVVIDDFGNAFYDENDQPKSGIFFCDTPFRKIIEQQEKKRFRLEDGEFLRCFVSIVKKKEMDFLFLMHHLGGDGKSLCYFIESFLKSLNNEELEYHNIELLTENSLPKKSRLPLAAKMIVKYYNRQWKKEKSVFTFEEMQKAYDYFWSNHETKIELYTIEEAELTRILKECKSAKIGFTSYYISKRLMDFDGIQDIGLAVDGRINGNRTMSNQATGISVSYRYDKKKSVVENAKKIDKLMKKKLCKMKYKYFILHFMGAFDPTLVDAINLEYAGVFHSKTSQKLAKILGYGYKTMDLSITNLTRLDISINYGLFKIKEFWFVPPVVSYGKNIIGIATVNNRLTVTVHRYLSCNN